MHRVSWILDEVGENLGKGSNDFGKTIFSNNKKFDVRQICSSEKIQ